MKNKKTKYIIVIILLLIACSYVLQQTTKYYQAQGIADATYVKLLIIDKDLDKISLTANTLVDEINFSNKLIDLVNNLTINNYSESKNKLIELANKITDKSLKNKYLGQINLLDRQKFKVTVKNLNKLKVNYKYYINRQYAKYDSQSTLIHNQLQLITKQASKISVDRLQQLTITRIKYEKINYL